MQNLIYQTKVTELTLGHDDKEYIFKLRDLPQEEKPREKLVKYGPENLTVAELLAVIFGVGNRKEDVLALSQRLIKEYGEKYIINEKSVQKLSQAFNIPMVKSCQLVACFELGRRFYKTTPARPQFLRTAKQVYEHIKEMGLLPKEHLRGIYLDHHYRIVHDEILSIGTLTANLIHPREVFRPALEHAATAVVLAHNHPSGVVEPSQSDVEITNQLVKAGKILGITLLDHIVVGKNKFLSIPIKYE